MVGAVALESAPSDVCTTPVDKFPPAAPKGLSAVAGTGVISLIWDANTEQDLAGYLVLRGEAPGDTLQPLMPAPIRETTFRDTTAKPGVRYVYAIVAVDVANAAEYERAVAASGGNGAVTRVRGARGAWARGEKR